MDIRDIRALIAQMTLEQLRTFDFGSYFSREFAGTPLPTLDEFLALAAQGGIKILNIEL